jgi:CRISPR-associated exonuclease Cas4
MLQEGKLPPPVNDARCRHCSLKDACQPEMVAATERLHQLRVNLFAVEEEPCDSF